MSNPTEGHTGDPAPVSAPPAATKCDGVAAAPCPEEAGQEVCQQLPSRTTVVAFALKRKKLHSAAESPSSRANRDSDSRQIPKRRRRGFEACDVTDEEDYEAADGRSQRSKHGEVEVIAGFEGRRSQSLHSRDVKSPLVIPLQQNTYSRLRAARYMPESHLSPAKAASSGREAAAPTVLSNVGSTYGLQRRTRTASRAPLCDELVPDERPKSVENAGTTEVNRTETEREADLLPEQLLERKAAQELREESRSRGNTAEESERSGGGLVVPIADDTGGKRNDSYVRLDEEGRYRSDIALCPDEAALDVYDRVPVSEFGAAVLRGMGWKEGEAIGKNPKNTLVAPIEFLQRPSLLGLGAQPSSQIAQTSSKRFLKPGETRGQKPDLVLPPSKDGKVRHYRYVGERLVERSSLNG